MKKSPLFPLLGWALLLLFPLMAEAHPGHIGPHGLLSGFAHPMLGLDHILAMVGVGIWAQQLGGRAIWLVPSSFVVAMAIGGVLGIEGAVIPYVEQGIMASVMLLGLIIAGALRMPLWCSALLVACFAIFHGFAHGTEIPYATSAVAYSCGFIMATALLHVTGIAIGALAQRIGANMVRVTGAVITLSGIWLTLA